MNSHEPARMSEKEMLAQVEAQSKAEAAEEKISEKLTRKKRAQLNIEHADKVPELVSQVLEVARGLYEDFIRLDQGVKQATPLKIQKPSTFKRRGLLRRKVEVPGKRVKRLAWFVGSLNEDSVDLIYLLHGGFLFMQRMEVEGTFTFSEIILTEKNLAKLTFSTLSEMLETLKSKRRTLPLEFE